MTTTEQSHDRQTTTADVDRASPVEPDDVSRNRTEWRERRPHRLLAILDEDPELTAPFLRHGSVAGDRLDPHTQELVSTRVAATYHNRYIWTARSAIALERGALSYDEIVRVTAGPTAFGGRDAAVLSAVDHVLAQRPIDAGTRLALGPDLLSLTLAIKFYETVAYLSRDLEPEPDPEPVAGIETPARAGGIYADRVS